MFPFLLLGHYICDGVDPDVGREDLTDRWFTYDDEEVTQTSGDAVRAKRQRDSYILFYQRIVSKKHCAHVRWHETHHGNAEMLNQSVICFSLS